MCEADLIAVLGVEHASYDYPWSRRIFLDCLQVGYCCLVAETGAGIRGHAIMMVRAGEAHILNLCIEPDARRQGLAGRMLAELLEVAARTHARTAFLEVRPSNAAAIGLYEGAGFHEVGRRPNYYPAPFGREDANFSQGWTSFYWAWWISWSPFVGMFIARVSRGRTIREFCIGVLVVPTLITFFWFAIMGGTGLYQEFVMEGSAGLVAAVNEDIARPLFLVIESGVGGGIVVDGELFRGGHGLAGEIGHIHIADEDGELLDLLEQRGLLPGATVEVVTTRPLDGLLVVAVDGAEQLIGEPVAQKVVVEA